MKYFITLYFLILCNISNSQPLLKLEYWKKPDKQHNIETIKGYFKISSIDTTFSNQITSINQLLFYRYKNDYRFGNYSRIKNRNERFSSNEYMAKPNIFRNGAIFQTPEDSFDLVKELKIINYESAKILELNMTDTIKSISSSSHIELPYLAYDVLKGSYLFSVFSDSFLIVSFKEDSNNNFSGITTIFNINTGLELSLYDCIKEDKLGLFLKKIFLKATKKMKVNAKNIGYNMHVETCDLITYKISLIPELVFLDNEILFILNDAYDGENSFYNSINNSFKFKYFIKMNELTPYLKEDSFLFKLQKTIDYGKQ